MNHPKEKQDNKILNQLTLLSFEFVAVVLLSLAATFIFYWVSAHVVDNKIEAFDERLYLMVRYFSSPSLDKIMLFATFLGNTGFVVFPLVAIIIYYLFLQPHKWLAIKIAVVAVGSITINLLLKQLYSRARPNLDYMIEVSNFSFPSGHAMFSMSFYGLLIYIIWTRTNNSVISIGYCLLLGLLILSIGISRIYLGVHYPSDVIAGFVAGFLWLIIALSAMGFIETQFENNSKQWRNMR